MLTWSFSDWAGGLQMPGVVADEERRSRARRLRWVRGGHGARLRGSVANERLCRSVADGEWDEVCAGAAATSSVGSSQPVAGPPEAEPGEEAREGEEQRRLRPLQGPEVVGRLVDHPLPVALLVEPGEAGLDGRC